MAEVIQKLFLLNWNQIIIIDNNSPNESDKKLNEFSDKGYIYIQTGQNNGYAAGNNVGLKYAYKKGFKYGWILNNDIIIWDDSILNEFLRIFKIDDNVAVINPDIYSPEGYMFNRYAKRRSFWDYTGGYYFYKKKGRNLTLIDGYGYIWRPQGCCMIVDLEKINSVNYFDENTFLYCEEAILAEKVLLAGYRIACANNIRVIHNHSKTVKSAFEKNEIIKLHNSSFRYYLTRYRHFNNIQVKLCLFFARLNMYFSK